MQPVLNSWFPSKTTCLIYVAFVNNPANCYCLRRNHCIREVGGGNFARWILFHLSDAQTSETILCSWQI